MLNPELVREQPEEVKKKIATKGADPTVVDRFLKVDETRRQLIGEVQSWREKRNKLEKGEVEKGRRIKAMLKKLEPDLRAVEEEARMVLLQIPNLPLDDVPVGKDEAENKPVRSWGKLPKTNFKPKDHLELGESLGLIDVQTAGRVAGSRFGYLMREAVWLEFGLVRFALQTLTDEKIIAPLAKKAGVSPRLFVPVVPPVMIKPEVYTQMCRLSEDDKDERYYLEKDDLYLIGSAEHTLGPLHAGQTLTEEQLPLRYVGFSTSFRREAGSYGKDTRGIFRVHQFDKVEMESFTSPEDSAKEQEFIVSLQEYLMQQLEIPYQVMAVCTGDMGKPDARQYDINAWLPSQNRYRETHTADLMTDYQARRLQTKVIRKGQIEYVHMNDATAFAIGRTIIAILENYQQSDGTIVIPKVLRPFVGKDRIELPQA